MSPLPFAPGDLWLFAFSFFGLLLVPAALGRAAWIFPAGFAALGLLLMAAPASLHPARNVWMWLLLSQAPWLLLLPDLLARGRVARLLETVPLCALLAWSLVHFLGVRHVFTALSGGLSPDFALGLASSELLTGIGALLLWALCRPANPWFRLAALFWNVQAFAAVLALSVRLARAHPGLSIWSNPDAEAHLYFAAWPASLEAFFWMPLLLCLHLAVFFKLLRGHDDTVSARHSGDAA